MSTKSNTIELGDISFDVKYKDIKNVHLSVHPPHGRVTVSAPKHMDLETIRLFSISKLPWIRKQQSKLKKQKREAVRKFIARESHYYLGQRYLLKVIETTAKQQVILKHSSIELHIRSGSTKKQREDLLHAWYRDRLKEEVSPYVEKYEKRMGVSVDELGVRAMKTKWGTCNAKARRIWLNTELAKKPIESIEYVLVHEMVHLLERNHNDRFIHYMDKFYMKHLVHPFH